MTTQENTMILTEISNKLDKLIKLLEGKKNIEPLIQFNKACPSADDSFIIERTKEIFNSLDNKEGE